jgi:homoserine O-acetyltransferase
MDLPAYLQQQISTETRYFRLPDRLSLESGALLEDVVVAYRTWGHEEHGKDRAILICHALTGSADVESWWPGIIGQRGAFDPRRDFVICANILGSCYGSTGPVSQRPGTTERYRGHFPQITVRDMVQVQRQLLDHLGVRRLELVTGPSLGGMQALEWAATYPDYVETVVPIGVGGKHSAWCIGITEAQRAAIYADPDWNDGFYADDAGPTRGLAAARMMAVCSYRSWDSFHQRFGREQRDDGSFQVQSYLQHQGAKINERFDANTYVRLTQAMNTHDVSRGRGHFLEVLENLRQRALVVSVSSDILYPPQEQQLLAQYMPNARYEVLDSDHGHDGFLIQSNDLAKLIKSFRRAGASRAAA